MWSVLWGLLIFFWGIQTCYKVLTIPRYCIFLCDIYCMFLLTVAWIMWRCARYIVCILSSKLGICNDCTCGCWAKTLQHICYYISTPVGRDLCLWLPLLFTHNIVNLSKHTQNILMVMGYELLTTYITNINRNDL